jgi:hypothetical protein
LSARATAPRPVPSPAIDAGHLYISAAASKSVVRFVPHLGIGIIDSQRDHLRERIVSIGAIAADA